MKISKSYTSLNYSDRKNVTIDTIVLHHTGGSLRSSLNWLCHKESKVSAHYVIAKSGEIYQLVDEIHCAWHAGRSAFDYNKDGSISSDEKYLNRRSIGIELDSLGDSYTDKQLNSMRTLVLDIVLRRDINPEHIVGHKEIAPGRKIDPANFDMRDIRAKMHNALISAGIRLFE